MKILKIAPEFKCSPIWFSENDISISEPISPSDLSISSELLNLIENWDSMYQCTYNDDYPPDSGFLSIEEYQKYSKLAEIIKIKIIKELSSEYIIEFSEIVNETNDSINNRIIKILESCFDLNAYKKIMYYSENTEYKIYTIMEPKNTQLAINKKLLSYSHDEFVEYLLLNEIEIEDYLDKGTDKTVLIKENRIIESINTGEIIT